MGNSCLVIAEKNPLTVIRSEDKAKEKDIVSKQGKGIDAAKHDINVGEGVGKRADILDKSIKLIDEIDIEENTEQNESSGVIRGYGRECEDESEMMDISTQSGYEVHISQLEIKVAVALVPNEAERSRMSEGEV